jgi:uncharacterized protein YcfJ
MKQIVTAISIMFFIVLGGCASYGGYQPTVDSYNDPNRANIQQDLADCKALAQQSGSTGTEAVKGGAVGGLLGGAAGAAIGAVVGNPGAGAAMGAAAGGIGGAASTGVNADNQYKRAYNNCMRNRGHNVID